MLRFLLSDARLRGTAPAQLNKAFHVARQVFASVIHNVEIPAQRLPKPQHPHRPLLRIPFHEHLRQHGDAEALADRLYNCLRASALPDGMNRHLPQREAGLQHGANGASLFPHQKRILCQLLQRDSRFLRQR